MPGRILVIDPVATNRIIIKVKLSTARYDICQASTLADGLAIAKDDPPDLIIAGLSQCDCDGSLVTRIRAIPELARVPVIAIAQSLSPTERLTLLAAGADDVLSRPLDDAFVLARLRSLLRSSNATEELRLRDGTSRALGFAEAAVPFGPPPRVALVIRHRPDATLWRQALEIELGHEVEIWTPDAVLEQVDDENGPDALILAVETGMNPDQPLSILPELRSRKASRHAAVLAVLTGHNPALAVMALDLGASDVMPQGFDAKELALRLKIQISKKRDADRLRETVRDGLKLAMTDPLTGLFNRRYALPHLGRVAEKARGSGREFAVMLADLDRFKLVNDTYGHGAGDAVLIEVSRRLRENLRGVDLVARLGGEEFLITMPDSSLEEARVAAERLCRMIKQTPIALPGTQTSVFVTISIGIAMGPGGGPDEVPIEALIHTADKALYLSKSEGRDQVTVSLTAA